MESPNANKQTPNAEISSCDDKSCMLSTSSKYIYIVNWWKEYPESEYGGNFMIIASSDEECIKILKNFNRGASDDHLIPIQVKNAKKFELKDSTQKSQIVDSFTT